MKINYKELRKVHELEYDIAFYNRVVKLEEAVGMLTRSDAIAIIAARYQAEALDDLAGVVFDIAP